MMIESIEFKNFKALRDTKLPLGQFTLIVGPNGSGKSSVFQALKLMTGNVPPPFTQIASFERDALAYISVRVRWGSPFPEGTTSWRIGGQEGSAIDHFAPSGQKVPRKEHSERHDYFKRLRVFALDPARLPTAAALSTSPELAEDGGGLAALIQQLRDTDEDRFDALSTEFSRLLPEYDRITFGLEGQARTIVLRTASGGHKVNAKEVSQGTLIALAILTLAYLPKPPPLIGFEEPDRGLHPRLLTDLRDALYRLAYPDRFGEKREPVQVIATTHNPYFLRLFRDHPEGIVIAEKVGQEAKFVRLVDHFEIDEILRDADLGEVWYTGVLGGVPAGR
jgi:predicted ATPase